MAAIAALADRYRFRVIEDAAHAIGAQYRGTRTGDCRYSDMTVYSFHPVKIITSAEGGVITTNDAELHRRLLLLRSHGMERDPSRFARPSDGAWYYEMTCLGYNYRMTDVQAALGHSQLARIEEFIAIRQGQADRYGQLLADLPLRLPVTAPSGRSSWHIYVVELLGGKRNRRAVFDGLRAAGIGAAVHYFPVHLQPYYRARGFGEGDFPAAESYYRNALTLPLFPGLTVAQQELVASTLRGLMTCD
jgi:dTDP-4-amino-4,6-dideoxygalactose transaminase